MTNAGHNAADPVAAARDRHRAFAILRILADLPGTVAHDDLLQELLGFWGFRDSRDRLRSALDRLEAAGLIVKSDAPYGTVVAHLTGTGEEAADGRLEVDEVHKPSAGFWARAEL